MSRPVLTDRTWKKAVGDEIAAHTRILWQSEAETPIEDLAPNIIVAVIGTTDAIWCFELENRSDEISRRVGIPVGFTCPERTAEALIEATAGEATSRYLENGEYAALVAIHLALLVRLKEMPYNEYLATDHWRATRARAIASIDGRCALDARHPAEHVHHRTYERRGRERLEDLIVLCKECHARHHGKGRA